MILFFKKAASVSGVNKALQQAGLPANTARQMVYSEIDLVLCIVDSLKPLKTAHKHLVASYVFLEFVAAKYDRWGYLTQESKLNLATELRELMMNSVEGELIAHALNAIMHIFLGENLMSEQEVIAQFGAEVSSARTLAMVAN